MPKTYISNSEESVRMFKSNWMEALSKVPFFVPLIVYIPVIAFLTYESFAQGAGIGYFFLFLIFGLFIWTITEYILHRFVFHFVPKSKWGQRLHFIFHGVHHDYPQDANRLVMPPSASIPLAILFYLFFRLFFSDLGHLLSFFTGFITGYLIYDMMHYAFHHFRINNKFFQKLKAQHMLHHYQDPHKGYGVSSLIWDDLFRTNFPAKKMTSGKTTVSK